LTPPVWRAASTTIESRWDRVSKPERCYSWD